MSSISPAAVSSLSQAELAQKISVRVAAKTLDAAKAQGEAALSLLQAAADMQQQALGQLEPHKGQAVDITV